MEAITHTIISATPGFITVYQVGDRLEALEAVIAWRVETFQGSREDSSYSHSYPLTAHGDVTSACVGVQQPDGQVLIFGEGSIYSSLDKADRQVQGKTDVGQLDCK